jgi:glucose-1-phosphate thymidylyltransferase
VMGPRLNTSSEVRRSLVRKGILVAGGTGTRLWPATRVVSKQLMPVYDKPMIYYPLTTLMLAGIREILVISTPEDLPRFRTLLGDGQHLGICLSYAEQPRPDGVAQAFTIGSDFIGESPVAIILGDNLLFGHNLSRELQKAAQHDDGATIFGYHVKDPQRYGVVEMDEEGRVVGIEEKPETPRSPYAIVGLYFYDSGAVDVARTLRRSKRGEYEITDMHRIYLEQGRLRVRILGRGIAWLDTGTHDSLLGASHFVAVVEERQGLKIGSPEEAAYRMGYIDDEGLVSLAAPLRQNAYGRYLLGLLDGRGPEPE